MNTPKYVIWDWNGTLFNDVSICISVQNEMLRKRKLRTIDDMEYYYRVFTFPILQYYINLGYDLDAESFEDICSSYVALYERDMVQCTLYEGALPLMRRLRESGIGQAVISAASRKSLAKQMAGKGLGELLDAAIGIDNDMAESKADNARTYVKALSVPPESILFIGDSLHDAEVAQACGCSAVLIADSHQSFGSLQRSGLPVYETLGEFADALNLPFGNIM